MSSVILPGDPRGPEAALGRSGRDLPGDPRARPARGTGAVLITGASGLLGRAVCAALRERGVAHRALVRPTSDRDGLAGRATWLIDGDLLRSSSLRGPVEGVTAVLHLAGLVRSDDEAALWALHVDGTRALVEAARAAGVGRIVAISSDTVHRARPGPYARSKMEMEGVLEHASGEAFGVTVLRPPMMLGAGAPHLRSLERAARLPVLPVPPGFGRRAPVHVDDVARAVVSALSVAGLERGYRALDLPGALPARSFEELVVAVARSRGWSPPRVIPVSDGATFAASAVLSVLGSRGRRIAGRLRGMAEDPPADGAPAATLLGWAPRSLEQALADCVR